MEIVVTINSCEDCRFLDHSGGFTPGGAIPVCRHKDVCYGVPHIKVEKQDTVVDVMMKVGMSKENAIKYVGMDFEGHLDDLVLLKKHKLGDCIPWMFRVPYFDWKNPKLPEWCPLVSGGSYKE